MVKWLSTKTIGYLTKGSNSEQYDTLHEPNHPHPRKLETGRDAMTHGHLRRTSYPSYLTEAFFLNDPEAVSSTVERCRYFHCNNLHGAPQNLDHFENRFQSCWPGDLVMIEVMDNSLVISLVATFML